MSEAATARWRDIERAAAPYTERFERRDSQLDRTLLETYAVLTRPFSRAVRRSREVVALVEREQERVDAMTDDELRVSAFHLRAKLLRSGFLPELVAQAFALVRTAAQRTVGLTHFPVQLLGGYVMLQGMLVEMGTGEGKTLAATLPAATAALAGVPVHIVTVNDYLAERDGEWMRPVYAALGLRVGVVKHGQQPAERRAAYAADITYCSNKELGFDYLRDTLVVDRDKGRGRLLLQKMLRQGDRIDRLVLRGLHFAIVDEADSVLIDEARTPLVIAGASDAVSELPLHGAALAIAAQLTQGVHFDLDTSERAARLTPRGRARLQQLTDVLPPEWRSTRAREEIAQLGLAALHLFELDTHYLVREGKVEIVDEFTGRVIEGRSWERGLQQLIETKEGCDVTGRHTTLARITYQRLFRRYVTLCGMTGTAAEVATELDAVYGLRVARIPPNRPSVRRDLGMRLYANRKLKWSAVAEVAIRMRDAGRPVLVGTRSVAASEELSALLAAHAVDHVVLNARQDKDEAEIVACAGEAGRITVATNMAGRGTDIRLQPEVVRSGGLHVILTELHESQRIDRQLFGRCARQGDPGSHEAIVSVEDELFSRYAPRQSALLALRFRDRTSAVPAYAAQILRVTAQRAAEAANSHIRRANLDLDWKLDSALAFAGRAG